MYPSKIKALVTQPAHMHTHMGDVHAFMYAHADCDLIYMLNYRDGFHVCFKKDFYVNCAG